MQEEHEGMVAMIGAICILFQMLAAFFTGCHAEKLKYFSLPRYHSRVPLSCLFYTFVIFLFLGRSITSKESLGQFCYDHCR